MKRTLALVLAVSVLLSYLPSGLILAENASPDGEAFAYEEEFAGEADFFEDMTEEFFSEEEPLDKEDSVAGQDVQEGEKAIRPSLALNFTEYTLREGKEESIQLELDGIDPAEISWTSSNTKVATVSDNGLVSGHKQGKAVITARVNDISVSCRIGVNDITYRALLIGNSYKKAWMYPQQIVAKDYYYDCLCIPAYEVNYVAKALKSMKGTKYSVTKVLDLTSARFADVIWNAFAKADDNDVSLIFYSGHGGNGGTLFADDGEEIQPDELRWILDQIPGRKVLLINSCYSGDLVGKDEEAVHSFNEGFIEAFRDDELTGRGTNYFENGSYDIITSASGDETALGVSRFKKLKKVSDTWFSPSSGLMLCGKKDKKYYYLTTNGTLYKILSLYGATSYYTWGLLNAMGFYFADTDKLNKIEQGALYGDKNYDGKITPTELYNYISNFVWNYSNAGSRSAKCYLTNGDTVVFQRDK